MKFRLILQLLFLFGFTGFAQQDFKIEFLNQYTQGDNDTEEAVADVEFRVIPEGDYEIKIFNLSLRESTRDDDFNLQKNDDIYRCQIPLNPALNKIRVYVYTPDFSESRMETIYFNKIQTIEPEILTKTDTVFQFDTVYLTDSIIQIITVTDTVNTGGTDTITLTEIIEKPVEFLDINLNSFTEFSTKSNGKFLVFEPTVNLEYTVISSVLGDCQCSLNTGMGNENIEQGTFERDNTFRHTLQLNSPNTKIDITCRDPAGNQKIKTVEFLYETDNCERTGKDYALFFAVQDYESSSFDQLRNPINDAHTLARILGKKYGFETKIIENPTKKEMDGILRSYISDKKFSDDDQLLIFISGHGVKDPNLKDKANFATIESVANDHSSMLPFREIRTLISFIECNKKLLIVDACYGGSIFNDVVTTKGGNLGLKQKRRICREMNQKTYKAITASDDIAIDKINGMPNSPFTFELCKILESGGGRDGLVGLSEIEVHLEEATEILMSDPKVHTLAPNWEDPDSDFLFIPKG